MHSDVIIIGSGQAGGPLASRLADAGRSVVLIERDHHGGTCINYGCTPTKTIIASARAAHVSRTAGRLGVETGKVTVDFPAIMARKDAIVEQWRSGIQRRMDGHDGITLVQGHARFSGPKTVEVDGIEHTADTVIINVGGRAIVPEIEGLSDIPWLDNAGILNLKQLPGHLIVMGGGYIGCEFGQAFRRFGSGVTMIGRAPTLLAREDEDVSATIEEVLREEGIALHLARTVEGVRGDEGGVTVSLDDGTEVTGTHLLVATGRRPNTDDLGVKAAGIELDERGFIRVDDHYRTTAEGVYAVGDVTGGPQFTHSSWDDHRILFDILEGEGTRTRADRVVPSSVFTDPQVARVGLTVKEAKARGLDYEVATMPFGHIARAIEIDETAGILKVIVDPSTERILGAAIVGAEAGELIHIFAVLIQAGAPASAIVDVEAAHPTFAEGVQSLVMKLERYQLS